MGLPKKIKLSNDAKGVLFAIFLFGVFFLTYGLIKDVSGARIIELQWHRDVDVIFSDIFNRLFG